MFKTSTKPHSYTQVSALALTIGLSTFSAANAQEAIVIEDGETVTDQQLLDQDGDSLTIDTGGILAVADDDAIIIDANDVTVANAGLIDTTFDGISAIGDNISVANKGDILSTEDDGIDVSGDGAKISNTGLI